jgi:hypothetical protein
MNSPNLTTVSLPPAKGRGIGRNRVDWVLELCPQKPAAASKLWKIQSPQMWRIHRPLMVAEVIGVSRSNLVEHLQQRPPRLIGRPPLPDEALAAALKPPNHERVYRVMKVHGLLLDRHAGGAERRHDGRIAVDERNRRWCSDG